jgi:hypothetical protein
VDHAHGTSSQGAHRTVMAPFRLHSLYWYYRKYHSRPYAELARFVLFVCVVADFSYRVLTRQDQVYGLRAALAAFRGLDALRRDQEHSSAGRLK